MNMTYASAQNKRRQNDFVDPTKRNQQGNKPEFLNAGELNGSAALQEQATIVSSCQIL